jgi:DNA-binding transcriptional MerR regulator
MGTNVVRIGELARRTGLSADSLRHYERRGLLPAAPRTAGGARRFSPLTERQVRAIQAALGIGFTLDELAELLGSRRRGIHPCRRVEALARAKLDALDRRIGELRAVRRTLAVTLEDWERRLASSGDSPAGLLDSLADAPLIERPNPRRKRSAKR